MKVVKSNKEAWDLFFEMLNDLSSEQLEYMSRFPEPTGELRYRDLLKKAYLETGRCLAIIWLSFESGLKKTFVFSIEAELKEGEYKGLESLPGKVRASLIEEMKGDRTIKVYNESTYNNGDEIIRYLELVGNKYRERELYVTMKNVLKEEME